MNSFFTNIQETEKIKNAFKESCFYPQPHMPKSLMQC